MRRYAVSASAFFTDDESKAPEFFRTNSVALREKCRMPMLELASKYEVREKTILSIGCGGAFEEYWFYRKGCSLTLVDIDELGTIEPFLRSLPEGTPGDTLIYWLGDAMEFLQIEDDVRFDVCYVSSFTPEEFHRRDIQANRRYRFPNARLFVNKWSMRLLEKEVFPDFSWPPGSNPHGRYVVAAMKNRIKDGGLLISQSYYGGVDVLANPHFIRDLARQLRRHRMQLLALYHFEPPYSAISLAVSVRGSTSSARAARRRFQSAPEITAFHGRSVYVSAIRRAFP